MIVKETGHSHAKEILEFLKTCTFPASPKKDGFLAIKCTPQMLMPLVILLPEDAGVGGIWQKQFDMSDRHMAGFVSDEGGKFAAIALKGQVQTSDFTKGILYLHEGKHAWHFQKAPKPRKRTPKERLQEELEVMEFECRLCRLYFGDDFGAFIEEEVERIQKLGASFGNRVVIEEKWFAATAPSFYSRFQKPVGVVEGQLFSSILVYAIVFAFIDKYARGDKQAIKLGFMAHVSHK